MPLTIGTKRISTTQQEYLRRAKSEPIPLLAEYLPLVVRDRDLQNGREDLHPDWLDLFEAHREQLRALMPQRALAVLTQELGERDLIDKEILSINPQKSRIAFLLGAGASKPKPSDIPTVKELLPDLLVRARRLDRADLQKLVDFCEETKIENIEDLLTAAQLSEFCGRNPNVLRLVEFLLFRRDPESKRMHSHRFFPETADLSGVAFLQDTL
jgi:hypothetical protein